VIVFFHSLQRTFDLLIEWVCVKEAFVVPVLK